MPTALTRREWLRLSAGALLSLGVWPGRLRGEDAPTSGPEARKAVAIILAMYQSAKKKGVAVKVSGGKAAVGKANSATKVKAKKKKIPKRR